MIVNNYHNYARQKMNLRDLEYLLAIDEERHFNRAAGRCFVSQPTLSGQLKKLEAELGVQLVERSNRQVVMTDAGNAIAAQARRVINNAHEIRNIAESFHNPFAGELKLGLIPTVAPYLLPLIMPELTRQLPQLRIWLYEQQTHVLLEKLARGEYDLLVLALPVSGDNAFTSIELFSEPFLLAVAKGVPIANNKQLQLSDLNGLELMLLEEGHCLRDHALDACTLAGARESTHFHATSLETLRHMVGEGMGMTLMPQLALPKRILKSDPICYLPFSEPAPNRRIGMLYRKGSARTLLFERIAELITNSV